ncbi:hypothetical protein [Streptomyces sp. NPDC002088]|uniref:hypothetical protein n=1 Tax=Streptomyces sp. NPDC002088 TaxID=3154665 RepID=UPI0033190056
MSARFVLLTVAYWAAVLALALAATYAANLLPLADPATASTADVTAGCLAALAALTWLPCPCHRKDRGR